MSKDPVDIAVDNMNPGAVLNQGLIAISQQLSQSPGSNIQLAALMANTAAVLMTAGSNHTDTQQKVADLQRLLLAGEKACRELEDFIIAVTEGKYVETMPSPGKEDTH